MKQTFYIIITLIFLEGIDCIVKETPLSLILGSLLIVSALMALLVHAVAHKTNIYWYWKGKKQEK